MTTFEVWGDSHLDDMAGIGARKALEYESHFRHDVEMLRNKARAGSTVHDWMNEFLKQPIYADVVVISSGFNEGVSIEMGLVSMEDVRDDWYLLIQAILNAGKKVLWVPTQFKWGRAPEFLTLEELHITPVCLGAELLDWVLFEDEISPDKVHCTYEASHLLAKTIMNKVAEMGNDGPS